MWENFLIMLLQGVRYLGALVCNFIYSLIAGIYQLFMTVSRLNILSSDEIGPIYQRVTMVLTIVMVFYITFEFVKYVLQPDNLTDKDKGVGNIVQRMIIVVVLIAFVPTIFSYAYKIQNRVLENQVFSKVLLGKTNSDYAKMGNSFSSNMLSLFYGIDEEVCLDGNCSSVEQTVINNLDVLEETGTANITNGIVETSEQTVNGEKTTQFMIKFDGLLAVVVGGVILWILLMYTIDVGTRYAQLIFLQVISPVAIISYISPKKDNMFSKWTKQCITTYLDLFIRLAIIYFVLLIIEILGNAFETNSLFAGMENLTPTIKSLSYVALVMGLLAFAQKAPKMLGELFPSGGSASIGYGLKASQRVAPAAARAIGASTSGIVGLASKGVTRIANESARRKKIKVDRLEQGLPTDRKSINSELQKAKKEERTARRNFDRKRRELEGMSRKINNAGTEDEKATAQKEFEKFKKDEYDKVKNKLTEARSRYAKAQNQSYGALIGLQGLGAAISGLGSGIKIGFEATKVEDIGKKISETAKNVKTNELSRMQFLEEGGSAEINASVQKTITKLKQTVGIRTASEIIKEEVKVIESKVKANESLASMEKSVKSAQDSSEDRAGKKIESKEQKIKISTTADIEKLNKDIGNDKNGLGIIISVGQTTSEIYSMYEAKANTARSNADAANKEAIRLKMNKDNLGITDEAIEKAQAYADSLSAQAVSAENAKEQALKHLKRYGITRTLRGDIGTIEGEKVDPVLAANIETMRQAIENARSNPSTIEYLENALSSNVFNAFKNNNILDFDTYDEIQGALTSHTVQLSNENSGLKETVRAIQASSATDAANATANATGVKK